MPQCLPQHARRARLHMQAKHPSSCGAAAAARRPRHLQLHDERLELVLPPGLAGGKHVERRSCARHTATGVTAQGGVEGERTAWHEWQARPWSVRVCVCVCGWVRVSCAPQRHPERSHTFLCHHAGDAHAAVVVWGSGSRRRGVRSSCRRCCCCCCCCCCCDAAPAGVGHTHHHIRARARHLQAEWGVGLGWMWW
jgi:hypothetical protein